MTTAAYIGATASLSLDPGFFLGDVHWSICYLTALLVVFVMPRYDPVNRHAG